MVKMLTLPNPFWGRPETTFDMLRAKNEGKRRTSKISATRLALAHGGSEIRPFPNPAVFYASPTIQNDWRCSSTMTPNSNFDWSRLFASTVARGA